MSAFSGERQRDIRSVPGGPIYEDADLLVKHLPVDETGRAYLGYLILETRRHARDIGDLTDSEAQKIGLWLSRLSRDLRSVLGADHVYAFVLGDHVPQFHVHLIARHPGTPLEYYGTRIADWPDAPHGDEQAIGELVARLRARLGDAITHVIGQQKGS
jgi:diadenosine tetraphosphate (Ap4A) HIT family hydrolase